MAGGPGGLHGNKCLGEPASDVEQLGLEVALRRVEGLVGDGLDLIGDVLLTFLGGHRRGLVDASLHVHTYARSASVTVA